jgi:hypothetical protein
MKNVDHRGRVSGTPFSTEGFSRNSEVISSIEFYEIDFLALEDWTSRLSQNVDKKLPLHSA